MISPRFISFLIAHKPIGGEVWPYGYLRFCHLVSCAMIVFKQNLHTAHYGFGAGLTYTDDAGNYVSGFSRKLTFGNINRENELR